MCSVKTRFYLTVVALRARKKWFDVSANVCRHLFQEGLVLLFIGEGVTSL